MSLTRWAVLLALFPAACGGDTASSPPTTTTAPVAPAERTPVDPVPKGPGHLAVMAPKDGLTLLARPGGRRLARLERRTRWGSPTVVWAVRRRGRWLGVIGESLPNNRLGWLDVRRARPRMWRSPLSLHADLSARTLELRSGRRVRRRIAVTIGAPSSPTPTGRFAVTDKLLPHRSRDVYGCCILALSGTQPVLRPGWAGGNRIAIHGSRAQATGTAASAGCLRATDRDLRALMRVVPVGTPVVISA